jgi:GDPmannose 4,6-dehydratase
MERSALITGITGQVGSYLAEMLLARGYRVHGTTRRLHDAGRSRIRHLLDRLTLHEADLLDQVVLMRLIREVRPREIYNLAAQSFVPTSWRQPAQTSNVNALGVARLLEAICAVDPSIRFYQASSSEMFGQVHETPQNESTPFCPSSPYAASKAFAHWVTVNFRESCGVFACSGISFNHESPRRGEQFVTRKITQAVARIKMGVKLPLRLGNIQSEKDWGFVGDHVRAMWLMLQQDEPEDYVIGTGETHSVEQFVEAAFQCADLDWREHVQIDPHLYRPKGPNVLVAEPTRARQQLGWQPEVSFEQLVELMVEADLARLARHHGTTSDRNCAAA